MQTLRPLLRSPFRSPVRTSAFALVASLGLAAPVAANIMVPIEVYFLGDGDIGELDMRVRDARPDTTIRENCVSYTRQFVSRNTLSPSRRAAAVQSCLAPQEPPEADFGDPQR
jgi:hypothetical protein